MSLRPLLERLKSAPVVLDATAAERAWDDLKSADPDAAAWLAVQPAVRELLSGVFANAPYLARSARRRADRLISLVSESPEAEAARLTESARRAGGEAETEEALKAELRQAKLDLHLLAAFADLGGVWSVGEVTTALTRFADASVQAALDGLVRFGGATGAAPESLRGFVALAMGKQGGFELNYSSDIDLIVLFDRDRLEVARGKDPQETATRLAKSLARMLQEQTADGYVWRVDLRLRPDPGATPPAVNLSAALRYYESLGQTWERAAMIKARPCAGDVALGDQFLKDVRPFVWRRSLDFAALDDLRAMKRQIQVHADAEGTRSAGAEVKRGYGGIREIEFFVQGHQLIHGGRDPRLRGKSTLSVLEDLVTAGHVEREVADALRADYLGLRTLEHRLQMVEDQQTHRVPEDAERRVRIAALHGEASLEAFDRTVEARMARVRGVVDELLRDSSEAPASPLSFGAAAGGEQATVERLRAAGFKEPERVVEAVRGWRAGRAPATRSQRARGLLDRVLPMVLEAASGTDSPDATFTRFADFFEHLPAGVQTLSLFASEPGVLRAVLDVLTIAPKLGAQLARRPELMDVMLDADFMRPVAFTDAGRIVKAIAAETEYERALNVARREAKEARFRVAAQAMMGVIDAEVAGEAQATIADTVVGALTAVARAEIVRKHGPIAASFAILALGKLGGRELSAASDLDLMAVYRPSGDGAMSTGERPLAVDTYHARLTQRLVTALSAQTEEGELYEVDMRLRPSGNAGPLAVRLSAFETYYEADAWTWELMALTRAQIIVADPELSSPLSAAIRRALTRPRDKAKVLTDAADMRARMAAERPSRGDWDLKLGPGGFVDIEFTVQALELIHAHESPEVLAASTRDAIANLMRAGALASEDARALHEALSLQLDLTQVLSVAIDGVLDPATASPRLKDRLARVAGASSFAALEDRLRRARAAAHGVFARIVQGPNA
jgi:glutamate-ammonia-ligase adenylyltransferase